MKLVIVRSLRFLSFFHSSSLRSPLDRDHQPNFFSPPHPSRRRWPLSLSLVLLHSHFLRSSSFVFYSTLSLIKGRLHSPTINIIYKSSNFFSYLNLRSMQDIGSMHLECNCASNRDVLSTNPGRRRTRCRATSWSYTDHVVEIAVWTEWTRERFCGCRRFGGHFHFLKKKSMRDPVRRQETSIN